jgi:hypothetical protein
VVGSRPRAFFLAASLFAVSFGALLATGCRAREPVVRGPGDGFSERGGVLFREAEPFTGIVVDTFPGGAVRARAGYAKGRRQGKSLEYYPSGKLRWAREYRRGVKEGLHEGWWENGRRMFAYRFRKGLYEGEALEWYPDGKPSRVMRYVHGEEKGLQRAWRPNGALYANYEVRDGRQYGIVNARLCYTVRDGKGVFHAAE